MSSSDEDGQPPVKLVKIGDLDSAAQVIEGAKSTIMILNEEVRKAKQEVNTQKGLRAKDLDKYTKEVERKKEEDRRKEERHQKDKNLYLKEISWWKENSIKKSDFLKGLEKLKEKAPLVQGRVKCDYCELEMNSDSLERHKLYNCQKLKRVNNEDIEPAV